MDFSFTEAQLLGWLQMFVWPLFRVGGMTMTMPLIGDRTTSPRIRLIFTLALVMAIVPTLPNQPVIEPFTAAWWLRSGQELLLGVMLGYLVKLVFEAAMLAGDLIGNSMGLGFAQMVDPVRGTSAPVVGSFYTIAFGLLFVTMGGHLQMIRLVALSFDAHPSAAGLIGPELFTSVAAMIGHSFAAGLQMALPLMAALMLVNLGFGVISRAAPSLNALSVGFPLSLLAGLLLLWLTMPSLPQVFSNISLPVFDLIRDIAGGTP